MTRTRSKSITNRKKEKKRSKTISSMPMDHKVDEIAAAAPTAVTSSAIDQKEEIDVSGMCQFLGNMVSLMKQLSAQLEEQRVETERGRLAKEVRDFMRLDPPTFDGKRDPIKADNWLWCTKSALDLLSITGTRRVALATFRLKGGARYWWDSMKKNKDMSTISWEEFEELFLAEYFPQSAKSQISRDFIDLVQGNMTVTEYEAKFLELSQFVPQMVSDELLKVQKFQDGLKTSIRKELAPLKITKYNEVVDTAMLIERELRELEQIHGQSNHLPNNKNNHQGFRGNKWQRIDNNDSD